MRESISRGLFVADWAYEPEFAPLATDPQFEEIKQQNLDGINRERAKLGLGPVKKVGL